MSQPFTTLESRAWIMRRCKTEAEDRLWQHLPAARLDGFKFRNQVKFEDRYIADFVCRSARLVVEVDGSQHAADAAYDARRTAYFARRGYRVIRFWNNEVFHEMERVLEAIRAALHAPLPGRSAAGPSPPPAERVRSPMSLPPEGEDSQASQQPT